MTVKRCVLLLACLACYGRSAVAEPAPYPVWWSPALELETIESVEQRLQRDLRPGTGDGFELYPDGDPNRASVHARTCDSLLRYSEQGYWPLSGIDIAPRAYSLALCRAIALLGQARPAEVSYLRDFSLDAEAVSYLPAPVNLYPSYEFICYAVAANRRGIALSQFDDVERIEVLADDRIAVGTAGWNVEMTFIARGDFSADGLEVVLLLAHGGATEGSYRATGLFVLTRDEQAGVSRVIDAEQRLCAGN